MLVTGKDKVFKINVFVLLLLMMSFVQAKQDATATIENEFIRVSFMPLNVDGTPSVRPVIFMNTSKGWSKLDADYQSEGYIVVVGNEEKLEYGQFYPNWDGKGSIFEAGKAVRFLPEKAYKSGNSILLEFDTKKIGKLKVRWSVEPSDPTIHVQMNFVPADSGSYSLGYRIFCKKTDMEIEELLLPMMYQRKRLPEEAQTILDPFSPTPIALIQMSQEACEQRIFALIGEPDEIPFKWPSRLEPNFGLMLRSEDGLIQPSICGPVPGTEKAKFRKGDRVNFSYRILVKNSDWYDGYRIAADKVFGFKDYRINGDTSLTESVFNMIDLVMDDWYGGWWDRAKGFYQIESRNGATHSAPLVLLSLYRLTDDERIYRERALPSMEYILSRSLAHFSPVPSDTGHYPKGGLNGPVLDFGTTTFGGFWKMTNRQTPAFERIAFPDIGIKPTSRGRSTHAQDFEDWLVKYEVTGKQAYLDKAKKLADEYIKANIEKASGSPVDVADFFLISYVPDWEGLLRMYEVTKEERYLDAAVFGARQLMTGVWTQPVIPEEPVTIHPEGKIQGHIPDIQMRKGNTTFRLGYVTAGDDPSLGKNYNPRFGTQVAPVKEHRVPSWLVSNVGLAFEQPTTYIHPLDPKKKGGMIYQNVWAPNFLRLAQYTGMKEFETYARNAVVGRWSNYPGYYATGFTDLPLDPQYPYVGPDVTDIYYHHIPVHLGWTIDYLMAEAYNLSGGMVEFPSERQTGYAYFNIRTYGHAPGKIFDHDRAWLWFNRKVVELNNSQINHITAHNSDNFFTILTNQSHKIEEVELNFSSKLLGVDSFAGKNLILLNEKGEVVKSIQNHGGNISLEIPCRGLRVAVIENVKVNVESQQKMPINEADIDNTYFTFPLKGANLKVGAAAIKVMPVKWDAYIWVNATPEQVNQIQFYYSIDGGASWEDFLDDEYPFELSIPVDSDEIELIFRVEGELLNAGKFKTTNKKLVSK